MDKNTGVVILAAGHGTRMKSNFPKVMHLLHGRPLIWHMVQMVRESGIGEELVVVVAPRQTLIQEYIGNNANYVIQPERLGTAHALAMAEPLLRGKVFQVVVMYGDIPFFSVESLRRLVQTHEETGAVVTMTTTVVPDFAEWRAPMDSFGRIIRAVDHAIIRFVEKKDATEIELVGRELNVGFYCFQAEWLWEHLPLVKNNNAQGEFYINDLIEMVIAEGHAIGSIMVDPREAVGISSQQDLALAHTI